MVREQKMNHLMQGLAVMVAAIVVFIVIAQFVTPTVITGTDTGSMLIKAVFLLIVGAIVIMTPLLIMVRMWRNASKD
jgi:uncharacterized RDD family membrane protein YckC